MSDAYRPSMAQSMAQSRLLRRSRFARLLFGPTGKRVRRLPAALCGLVCFPVAAALAQDAAVRADQRIADYIEANHKTPEAYIVEKFADRDIIFLGESHYVSSNLEFLQTLLPELYKAGVYTLVWEFANHKEQDKVDRLITGASYDEQLAKQIMADWYPVGFGYTEYGDVYRAAWRLNKSLPEDARTFRIVAVNIAEPIDKMEPGKTGDYDVRNRAHGGSFFHEINHAWARVIDEEAIQKNEKALVYAGAGHTTTRFYTDRRRPRGNGLSAGNFIYDYLGADRVMSINLHGSTGGPVAGKTVERVVEALPEAKQRVGMDTRGTPLGALPARAAGYLSEQGKSSDFTLADVTDGYIYLGTPLCEVEPVSAIPNFTDETTLALIQRRFSVYEPRDEPYTAEELDKIRAEKLAKYWAGQRERRFRCED